MNERVLSNARELKAAIESLIEFVEEYDVYEVRAELADDDPLRTEIGDKLFGNNVPLTDAQITEAESRDAAVANLAARLGFQAPTKPNDTKYVTYLGFTGIPIARVPGWCKQSIETDPNWYGRVSYLLTRVDELILESSREVQANPVTGPPRRVHVDLATLCVCIDGTLHPLQTRYQALFVNELAQEPGVWKAHPEIWKACEELDGTRLDRVLSRLPELVQQWIESSSFKGYRLRAVRAGISSP